MPLPLVVIEVPAQDRAASESTVLLQACTSALGGGRCELSGPLNAGTASAIAIVSWRDGDRLSALVEVARVQQPSEGWRSEELRFKPEDRRAERFRTLGLAIATLFREASLAHSDETAAQDAAAAAKKQAAPAAAPGEAEKPARAKPVPAKAEPAKEAEQTETGAPKGARGAARGAQAWISAGALAAYDPELGDWHYGGLLKLAVGAATFPGFVSAFGSYATGPALGEVSLGWAAVGGGPGLRFTVSPGVELRGVVDALAVDVSGRASELGMISRQSAWVPGVGLQLELALHAAGKLSGALGAQVQQMAGNVPIREHEQLIGTVGRTTVGLTLTLEFSVLGQAGSD